MQKFTTTERLLEPLTSLIEESMGNLVIDTIKSPETTSNLFSGSTSACISDYERKSSVFSNEDVLFQMDVLKK